MRIRSRAFDYDEMALSSHLLESSGRYSKIPLPPNASPYTTKENHTKPESDSNLYDVIGSMIPKTLVCIRPLTKQEIMAQFFDSNAEAFQRYDSNLRDILKCTEYMDDKNQHVIPIEYEYYIENINSNIMDHPRMIPITRQLPLLSQEEKVEPLVNDTAKKFIDSVVLGQKTSNRKRARMQTIKDDQTFQKEKLVGASRTSVPSFLQNTMTQIMRDMKLEEWNLEESSVITIARNDDLQQYLEKKKSQWEIDRFLRQSLRTVVKASHFSWNAMLPHQYHSNKIIVPNIEFSIHIDPVLPLPSTLGMGPTDLSFRCIVETTNQCKSILLDHLGITSAISAPCMTSRRYHSRNRSGLQCALKPKVGSISSYTQSRQVLTPSEFMIKFCPLFHIKWQEYVSMDDSNIYDVPMDIVPFRFINDPPLPNQSKRDIFMNENTMHDTPNMTISWGMSNILDAMNIRGSLVCKRKSKGKRNTAIIVNAEEVTTKNRPILNGFHIVGLNRIIEKYKIGGLFLPLPTQVSSVDPMAYFKMLPLPSLLHSFFPLEIRQRRDVQRFSLKDILHTKYDDPSCILNIGLYTKDLAFHAIQNDTSDDEVLLRDHLEMLNEHVANIGELLHLLSKTIDLRGFKRNNSNSANAHTPIFDNNEQPKPNSSGKLSTSYLEGDTLEHSKIDSKKLKKEHKKRKKEERKKRKLERKEERRKKKQKNDKIDSIVKRKGEDEQSVQIKEDECIRNNVHSTAAKDGVMTITVPKLHVGVTPMMVARKTYAVQTTVTEEVFFQGDPSRETNNSNDCIVQNSLHLLDQKTRHARSTSPVTHTNANTTQPNSCYKTDCHGSTSIETKGAVGITPPSDRKQIPSLQLENHSAQALNDSDHPINQVIDIIEQDSPNCENNQQSNWTNNKVDTMRSVTDHTSFSVLCSENFLEHASPVAAALSSGRWALCRLDRTDVTHDAIKVDDTSLSDVTKFTLHDCSIVDACGVDLDLGRGIAIKLFFPPPSVSLSTYMKDFIRKMVHITSSGRYREIHLFLVMDNISSPCHHVNDFCLLQNALIRQPGCTCENIRIHYIYQDILPFNIARIILSSGPSYPHTDYYHSMDSDVVTRAHFLLGIAPSLSAHECMTLISNTMSKPFLDVILSFMENATENDVKPLARAQLEACYRSSLGGNIF
jgi:hypothetical protein